MGASKQDKSACKAAVKGHEASLSSCNEAERKMYVGLWEGAGREQVPALAGSLDYTAWTRGVRYNSTEIPFGRILNIHCSALVKGPRSVLMPPWPCGSGGQLQLNRSGDASGRAASPWKRRTSPFMTNSFSGEVEGEAMWAPIETS